MRGEVWQGSEGEDLRVDAGVMILALPTLASLPTGFDDTEPQPGLNATDDWPEEDALIISITYASAGDGDGEEDGQGAVHTKKARQTKAELQQSLAERDPYKLLELDELRWRASADDVKKAYRRMVLKHHPDKAQGAADDGGDAGGKEAAAEQPGGDDGDEMFKAVTEAFELLSDPKRRRDFDSLDDFDDSLPPKDYDPSSHGDFFGVFGPFFERNSRWSELPNAPLLGNAETPYDAVVSMYDFWFDFRSWRDFADADEYDVETASFREERRWMERNNEKLRVKRRKDEKARLARLVELAYAHDPRIRAEKQRQKDAKAAVKAERANALLRDREAAAAAEAAKQEAARLAAEKEMAEAAERKKQKERAAKALRKAKQRLRALATGVNATGVNAMGVNVTGGASPGSAAEGGSGGAPLCGEAHLELLCARLSAEAIEELCDAADKAPGQAGQLLRIAIEVEEASLAKETAVEQAAAAAARAGGAGGGSVTSGVGNHTQTPWTDEELSLLAKAANKFPGGLPDRWTLMAEFINRFAHPAHGRTADEVTNKVKEQRRAFEARKPAAAAASMAPPPPPSAPPSKPATSPAPKASPAPAPAKAGSGAAPVAASSAAATPAAAAPAAAPASAAPVEAEWSLEEQRALEAALKKVPASVGEGRWERIAEEVPGKTKGECVKRYKEIVAALKAKKAAGP
jgi:DnaJ homolog subfamily C member 2